MNVHVGHKYIFLVEYKGGGALRKDLSDGNKYDKTDLNKKIFKLE